MPEPTAANLRSLLIEADSFISHMLYRGSWPGERYEVESLIGKLRSAAKSLETVVPCGERFEVPGKYVSMCELPKGHDGPHTLASGVRS